MNERPTSLQLALDNGGPVGAAIVNLVEAIYRDDALDAKTRELVFLGIQTSLGLASVRTHIGRAIAAGARRQEIVAVIMLAAANGGISGSLLALPMALEALQTRSE